MKDIKTHNTIETIANRNGGLKMPETAYDILKRYHEEYETLRDFPQISSDALKQTIKAMEEYSRQQNADLRKIVFMRTNCDCMVASFAMLMDWTYEEAAQFFPPNAVKKTGYRWEWFVPYVRANRIYLTQFDAQIISLVDWSKPAMVDVPSLTSPERGDHIIFWNGSKVIDPSPNEPRYTELPLQINEVYQLRKV